MPSKSPITQQAVSSIKLLRAMEMRREMTLAEGKLWAHLRAGRLNGFHFRRQQIIEPYIVDFYCHQAALIVEVDGEIHSGQKDYDQQRDQDLQLLGFKVLHFTNTEVIKNIEGVLSTISHMCSMATSNEPEGP